jgi:hypothetical protein
MENPTLIFQLRLQNKKHFLFRLQNKKHFLLRTVGPHALLRQAADRTDYSCGIVLVCRGRGPPTHPLHPRIGHQHRGSHSSHGSSSACGSTVPKKVARGEPERKPLFYRGRRVFNRLLATVSSLPKTIAPPLFFCTVQLRSSPNSSLILIIDSRKSKRCQHFRSYNSLLSKSKRFPIIFILGIRAV